MTPPRFSILSLSYLQFGLWSLDISAALPITKHSSTIPSISNYEGPTKITKYSLLCSNHFCRNWSTTVTVNPVRSDIDFSLICLIDIARIDISPLAPCEIHVDYMD